MKKLITLIIAGCFILGSLGTAAAVDVKVNGQWQFAYGYYDNYNLYNNDKYDDHRDATNFRVRLRTQVQFIASETLSAMLNFEIGDLDYGRGGGLLDADARDQIKIKHAYMDWIIPGTQIKTRQGVQGLRMPWVVAGNPVMDADVAGVTVSTDFTPEFGMTVFWARPYDVNTGEAGVNAYDEMDMFGVMLPIKTQAVRMTPWAMFAMIGKDSGYFGPNAELSNVGTNTFANGRGRGRAILNPQDADNTAYGYWAGTTFELPILDPFFVKFDGMIGALRTGDSDSNTWGYFLSTDIGYKFSWGTPSFIGWYSSGDKNQDKRRTIPIVSDDNGFFMTSYGLQGKYSRNLDAALSPNGLGMWGIGLQIKDVSFVQNLNHTARIMYMRGTNEGDAAYTPGSDAQRRLYQGGATGNGHYVYMLTSDSAWEFNLRSVYTVNENLEVGLDLAYLTLDTGPQHTTTNDSFAVMLGFNYKF